MPDILAKAMAVIMGLLLAGTVAVLVVTSRPPSGSQEVVAEFRDAFPIIEGMQVRTNGAPAGSVGKTRVSDEGLATVTLLLDQDVPAPRADATASIRQFDSTGDSYIAYEPGRAAAALGEKDGKPRISCAAPAPGDPCTNTLAAPRLDDLINAFGPAEEAGVKLILQSLSDALESRGTDVNRAALRLVPMLDAADTALTEVNRQNAALKSVITDMEAVARQGASKSTELGELIDGLASTLASTAARTEPLDAGLEKLPQAQAQVRSVLAGLDDAARRTTPLARELSRAAPRLTTVLDRAPGFLDDLRTAVRDGRPTLELTRKLLVAGAPTIAADPQRVVTGAFDLAPAVSNLLKGILGSDETIKAFFGDDKNGGPETREGYGFGLGAVASEPGDQPGFPDDWTRRNFVRVSAVLNCEVFGAKVAPGCLADLLRDAERRRGSRGAPAAERPRRLLPTTSRPRRPQAPGTSSRPSGGGGNVPQDTVQGVLDALGTIGLGERPAQQGTDGEPRLGAVSDLLGYLLN